MQKRLTMKKILEILRMKWVLNRTHRKIAISINASSSTVSECVCRARREGLDWEAAKGFTESELHELLYTGKARTNSPPDAQINWPDIYKELKRKEVTLQLLWQEYKVTYLDGFSYSRYCHYYRRWKKKSDVSMRQNHKAGEKVFVDYAGLTAQVIDKTTGDIQKVQIFVGSLGASSYLFAEATWTQSLPDWLGSHVRMFEFFGGVTEVIVPDNLKSGVTNAHRYDPEINGSYTELAEHYHAAVIPSRVRAPKDKAKAEQGVQQVERQILAPLRHRQFFSLAELNDAIRKLLAEINKKCFQKRPGSRLSQFEEIDKPVLNPLPKQRFELGYWVKVSAGKDYHVEVLEHYYSVPYRLAREKMYARYTQTIVEIFHNNQRVASHHLSHEKGQSTTLKAHMPKAHQYYADCTPDNCRTKAIKIGDETAALVKALFAQSKHEQQAVKWSEGLFSLGRSYGHDRLERACARANAVNCVSYKSIESILKNNLDSLTFTDDDQVDAEKEATKQPHQFVRGSKYYQ